VAKRKASKSRAKSKLAKKQSQRESKQKHKPKKKGAATPKTSVNEDRSHAKTSFTDHKGETKRVEQTFIDFKKGVQSFNADPILNKDRDKLSLMVWDGEKGVAKRALKLLKMNESTISMILGAVVIVVVGVIVINFFRTDEGETIPVMESEISLPTTHTVSSGEDLWKIAENYYGSGYNWLDIAETNNITNPNMVIEGQELTIPDVEPRLIGDLITEVKPSPSLIPTQKPKEEAVLEPVSTMEEQLISGATYKVVQGDNLWEIAVRAYGDGYRWVDIAKANKLVNPNLIHAGNEFIIPR